MISAVHPKAGAAALGGTAGTLLVLLLESFGVHMAPALPAAIAAFTGALTSFLWPSSDVTVAAPSRPAPLPADPGNAKQEAPKPLLAPGPSDG